MSWLIAHPDVTFTFNRVLNINQPSFFFISREQDNFHVDHSDIIAWYLCVPYTSGPSGLRVVNRKEHMDIFTCANIYLVGMVAIVTCMIYLSER